MKRIFCFLLLSVLLFFPSGAEAYEVLFYGNLTQPPPENGVVLRIDLGGHELGEGEWGNILESSSNTVLLPSLSDIEKRISFLEENREKVLGVVVSDLFLEGSSTFSPFLSFTHNYHQVLIFNFLHDDPDVPWDEYLKETEEADSIIVVGTGENLPLLREKFSAEEGEKVQFVERDSSPDFQKKLAVEEKSLLFFFYSSRCPTCQQLKNEVVPPLVDKYKDKIKVIYLDYLFSDNYKKMVEWEEHWQVKNITSVEVFSDAGFVAEEDEKKFASKLEELIQKTVESGKKEISPPPEGEDLIFRRFRKFTPWIIMGAGLLDGLNPCAFATIVFMVNLLLLLGHSRRRILEVGLTYSAAVFVTYLLIGLGLFQFWQALSVYQTASRVLYLIMALLLLVFAALSIKDAIQYKREGKETGMTLGLPESWRRRINQYLKNSFTEKNLVVAAILSGFVISLLEAGCTGQIYLPTIMYIAQATPYRWQALGYLVLYNAFFMIPLLAVFLAIFWGSQSKALVNFARKNIVFSKIALAALFIFLSLLLLGQSGWISWRIL
ncbi:MAG TPA: hypothetical protein PKZ70_03850 [Candidatus Atribacteria bacterium]|nr:hypothetical protein [Candidatus Atribacteria bacterium]